MRPSRGLAGASVVLLSSGLGCVGSLGDAPAGKEPPAGPKPTTNVACAESKTDEVRMLLEPTCAGCHGQGSNKPFFASLAAFENLLVAGYVTPGDADASLLVRLLEGKAEGLFKQMPPSGESFAALAAAGKTQTDVAAVRAWISELEEAPPNQLPDFATISTRRLTAEEILSTLMDQIGLVFEDDFVSGYGQNYGSPTVTLTGDVAAYSPDSAPPPHAAGDQEARFLALGGPGWMARRPRDQAISPPFLQTLVQVSQAWCRMAVMKPGNIALFAKTSVAATSAASEKEIRANIAYLYLRMLGEAPTDDDITRVYDEIFLRYEPEGSEVAWTAVCAGFVRHPLWLSL